MEERGLPEGGCFEPDSWCCFIPGYDLINPNKLMRMHWAARKKALKNLLQMVLVYGDKPIPTFQSRVKISVTRSWGKRKRAFDIDNLYGGCKLLLDALKEKGGLGIISDDSPKQVLLEVRQEKSGDDIGGIRIIVEVSEEGPNDQ